jgi:hypothetical protein
MVDIQLQVWRSLMKFREFDKPTIEITLILNINGLDPMQVWEEILSYES